LLHYWSIVPHSSKNFAHIQKANVSNLIMNGTSKINSAASVSNTRTLGRRLPPNLKTKSKCAIKQHPINKRVIRVITLTGMPPLKIFASGTQSSRQVETTRQTLCSRQQIKFARGNKVWEIPHKNRGGEQ